MWIKVHRDAIKVWPQLLILGDWFYHREMTLNAMLNKHFHKPKCLITTSTCVRLLGSSFLIISTIKFSQELHEANQPTLKGCTNT